MDSAKEFKKRRLSDLPWLGIVHVFAELCGVAVDVRYFVEYGCEVDYKWRERVNGDGGPTVHSYQTGLSKMFDDEEKSAKHLLQGLFRHYARDGIGPFKGLPEISFETKEELEMKLVAAGYDPEFMLAHRCG